MFAKYIVILSLSIGLYNISNAAVLRDLPYYQLLGEKDDEKRDEVCQLDLAYPDDQENFKTIVWLHAGGLKRGNRYLPGELRKAGFAVVAVDYRKYPEAKCPDFIEDAAAATAWTIKNIKRYGGDPNKVIIAGASAGAYLSLMVGLDKQWLGKWGINANQLLGIGSLTAQVITHVAVREESKTNRMTPVIDQWAPLRHVRKDAPPLLLVTGDRELELLGRYEENAYFHRMLGLVGHSQNELHEIKGADHGAVEKPGHHFLITFAEKLTVAE